MLHVLVRIAAALLLLVQLLLYLMVVAAVLIGPLCLGPPASSLLMTSSVSDRRVLPLCSFVATVTSSALPCPTALSWRQGGALCTCVDGGGGVWVSARVSASAA